MSADPPQIQQKFAKRFDMPFGLLTDTKWELRRKVGTPRPTRREIFRITYVVDHAGKLNLVWFYEGLGDVEEHPRQALAAIERMKDGAAS